MRTTLGMIALTAILVAACQPPAAPAAKEEKKQELTKETLTEKDQLSYALGADIGKSLAKDGVEINMDVLAQGVSDVLEKKELLLTDEDIRKLKMAHRKARMDARKKKQEEEGNKNKEAGEKFLEENKTKDGVVVLESGLQYKILTEGDGPKPKETDKVSVHYKGTLIDGKEFDSSQKRGKPAEFLVGRVVKGWTEALQLMPVGSKWQLFIPADLGYGARGAGRDIGPHSVLVFEIELLGIVEPKPAE